MGLLAIIALVLSACGGIADSVKSSAEALEARLAAVTTDIAKARTAADQRLAKPDAAFLATNKPGALGNGFDEAAKLRQQAQSVYDGKIKPLLDTNEEADAASVSQLVKSANQLLDQAGAALKRPLPRIEGIVALKANESTATAQAAASTKSIALASDEIAGLAAGAKQTHPASIQSIDAHVAPLIKLATESERALSIIEAERKQSPVDYVAIYDATQVIATSGPEAIKLRDTLRTEFAQLDTSVVRTLVDMKISCTIKVSRTSWDNGSDGGEETLNYAPVVLNTDNQRGSGLCAYWSTIADNFETNGDSEWRIGYIESGFTSMKPFATEKFVDRAMWDGLGLDPLQQWKKGGWGGHNAADFNLEDVADLKYWHKIQVVTNGKVAPATWVEVTPEEFDDREYDLLMDIYEKPAGAFTDEANEEAAPAGMVYVNDPNYGAWEQDSTGNTYWAWYGQYRFWGDLLGGPVYQSDYRDYRSNYYGKTGYYGNAGGRDRWGTLAPQSSAKFRTASWVTSGGQSASVRGAGPSGRAGGPGGGGK